MVCGAVVTLVDCLHLLTAVFVVGVAFWPSIPVCFRVLDVWLGLSREVAAQSSKGLPLFVLCFAIAHVLTTCFCWGLVLLCALHLGLLSQLVPSSLDKLAGSMRHTIVFRASFVQ